VKLYYTSNLQTYVSWHSQLRTAMEGFIGAKFYCLHTLADDI